MSESLPKFSVKELADRLKVSTRFVYLMKRFGFKMELDPKLHCYLSTEEEARKWIEATGFRIVKGKGRVSKNASIPRRHINYETERKNNRTM